jgi:hypothetical protein
MTGKRLLFYPELREQAQEIVGPIWKIGPSDQKDISTLNDLVKEIDKQSSLDLLVIFLHGYSGGMMLDDEDGNSKGYDLGEEVVTKAFAKTKTRIEHIRFEGCWVGEGPDDMATFGRLFNAQDVSGFTWVHWSNDITVTIPKGLTADGLKTFLEKNGLAKWLAPTTPPMTQLASMAQSKEAPKKLWLEWFQATLDKKAPYEDQDGKLAAGSGKRSNLQQLGFHIYKVRSDAISRTVLAKDAKPSSGGFSAFEYVSVKLR